MGKWAFAFNFMSRLSTSDICVCRPLNSKDFLHNQIPRTPYRYLSTCAVILPSWKIPFSKLHFGLLIGLLKGDLLHKEYTDTAQPTLWLCSCTFFSCSVAFMSASAWTLDSVSPIQVWNCSKLSSYEESCTTHTSSLRRVSDSWSVVDSHLSRSCRSSWRIISRPSVAVVGYSRSPCSMVEWTCEAPSSFSTSSSCRKG